MALIAYLHYTSCLNTGLISSLIPKRGLEMSLTPLESCHSPRLHLHSRVKVHWWQQQQKGNRRICNICQQVNDLQVPSRSFPAFTDYFVITLLLTYTNFMSVSTEKCFLVKITLLYCHS